MTKPMSYAGLRLTYLWLILIPYLIWGLMLGLRDWLREIRQVRWKLDEKMRFWLFCRREVLDPGVHLREAVQAKLPTNYRANP